jgi:hypothetical protein
METMKNNVETHCESGQPELYRMYEVNHRPDILTMEFAPMASLPDALQTHTQVSLQQVAELIRHDEALYHQAERFHPSYTPDYTDVSRMPLPYVTPSKPFFDTDRWAFPPQSLYVAWRVTHRPWCREETASWCRRIAAMTDAALAYCGPSDDTFFLVIRADFEGGGGAVSIFAYLAQLTKAFKLSLSRSFCMLSDPSLTPAAFSKQFDVDLMPYLPLYHDSQAILNDNPQTPDAQ